MYVTRQFLMGAHESKKDVTSSVNNLLYPQASTVYSTFDQSRHTFILL